MKQLRGSVVFKLKDTYGFPKELTEEILREQGLWYDEEEYKRLEEAQRQRGKRSWKGNKEVSR